jgi:hypothetical protein
MPLPHPSGKESKEAFIQKCAGDSVMNKEFPNQKNKLAVCFSIWQRSKGKHGAKASWEDYVKENRFGGINLLP